MSCEKYEFGGDKITLEITMTKDYLNTVAQYVVEVEYIDFVGVHGRYKLYKDINWPCCCGTGLFKWKYIDTIKVLR